MLLRGRLTIYQAPRLVLAGGIASAAFSTRGTVLAGCACAAAVAEFPVLGALLEAGVVRQLRANHLPLSESKTVFLASSPQLAKGLAAAWEARGLSFKRGLQARNLGTDANITRRGVHEGAARAVGALSRARRPRVLQSAGAPVVVVHRAGPTAAMLWGRTVTGVPDGELHSWRLAAARSAGKARGGAALGLRLMAADVSRSSDLDPSPALVRQAVQMAASLLQSGEVPLRMFAACLAEADRRHASASAPWAHCRTPVDALVLSLDGHSMDLLLMGPRELGLLAAAGARRASNRAELARLGHGAAPPMPLFWEAFSEVLGPRSRFDAREKAAVASYLSNAHWPQTRLRAAGERDHPRCCACGAARGSLWHRLFECPVLAAARRDSVSDRLRRRARRARDRSEAAGEIFARGWLPGPPRAARRTDAMAVMCVNRPEDGLPRGRLFLDWSAIDPGHESLRRAGWSIAQRGANGNLETAVYGTARLDLCPFQTAKDGEEFAVWMLSRFAGPNVEELCVDCASTVSCLKLGRRCAAAMGKPSARLLSATHASLDVDALKVAKVAAHCRAEDVREGRISEAVWRGNSHAAHWAKAGAHLHRCSAIARRGFSGTMLAVLELTRWIAQAFIIWQGIEAKDCRGLPEASERRSVSFAEPAVEQQGRQQP
ncbi:unnamed protein product [Prorocentrum cordatum]|uniref:Uncharacterized protein n=1 Tax=Prorocentrum cordatum TaxID=2364126 RepID=A0ABN9Q6L1_9DINO|nr:unnamed protein product [Polarella glacialis]